jgi:hypothetical protein
MRIATLFCLVLAVAAVCAAQDTNFSSGPQYLITFGTPTMLGSIATPSLSLSAPFPEMPGSFEAVPVIGSQPFISNPELRHQADLFPIYYGYTPISIVELTSSELPRELPASIIDAGVVRFTDVQSLRESGIGIPLSEAASYWKSHKPHTTHTYTNADLERFHTS